MTWTYDVITAEWVEGDHDEPVTAPGRPLSQTLKDLGDAEWEVVSAASLNDKLVVIV